jgi:hypothetical protein
MKRRAFSATVGGQPCELIDVKAHPIEVDLGAPDTMAGHWWRCGLTDAYVKLEERYPPSAPDPASDPMRWSGAELRLLEYGRWLSLAALIGNSHWVGWLPADRVGIFASVLTRYPGERFEAFLSEHYGEDQCPVSGARLLYSGGENTLGLYFGHHCLGVVKGQPLDALLECAIYRSGSKTGA